MKKIRNIVVLVILVLVCGNKANAVMDYVKLSEKAERFVHFQEWNSANAMYMLMLDQRPMESQLYSKAIVTSGLIDDEKLQLDLLERTQKNGIPLDSIFSGVRNFSFEVGESQEYEQFLKLVKDSHSWLSRPINVRLLDYYNFRNDATNMVSIGKELLGATPNDVGYLGVLARGYMLMGDFENAVITYEQILSIDNNNYDALIAMGNYYYVMWKEAEGTRSQMTSTKVKAQEYLQKAYNLCPTPFVEAKLTELKG